MPEPVESTAEDRQARAQAEVIDARWPFGPVFFVSQLRGFIRDRCPDPEIVLPQLQLHLVDGQELDVCHIVAIAPSWIALAVYERASSRGARRMRTELVPYAMIARITLEPTAPGGQLGFDVNRAPVIDVAGEAAGQSAEQAMMSACGHPLG